MDCPPEKETGVLHYFHKHLPDKERDLDTKHVDQDLLPEQEECKNKASFKPSKELNVLIFPKRVRCNICNRNFNSEIIGKHRAKCFKSYRMRSRVHPYDSERRRLKGFSKRYKNMARTARLPTKLTDISWRDKHEEWLRILGYPPEKQAEYLFKLPQNWRSVCDSYLLRLQGIISCPI